jgi:hypothetical protein
MALSERGSKLRPLAVRFLGSRLRAKIPELKPSNPSRQCEKVKNYRNAVGVLSSEIDI